MIANRLNDILVWYNEAHADPSRPELLAKLATLEMCGWIEEELDSIVRDASTASINDATWTNENVIKRNSGFTYDGHIRTMLCKLTGEILVRRIEATLDHTHPGDLAQLRSQLNALWTTRCALAHTALAAAARRQYTLDAPSVTVSNQAKLATLLAHLKASMTAELAKI